MLPTGSSPSEIVFISGASHQPAAAVPARPFPAAAAAIGSWQAAGTQQQELSRHARQLLAQVEYGPAIALAITKTQVLLDADNTSICLTENGADAVQHLLDGEDAAAVRQEQVASYPQLAEDNVLHRRGACSACRLQPQAVWCLSAPLYDEHQQIGMLCAMRKPPRTAFQPAQLRLLQALAFWSAIAISNARKLRAAQEQARSDRERIAAHLHDHTAQSLSTITLKMEQVEAALGPDQANSVRRDLDAIKEISRQLNAEVRAAFGELRQAAVQPGDLVSALAGCIDVFTETVHVPVEFSITGNCTLPGAAQTQAVQIVREALNNVARHAHASSVQVKLLGDRRAVRIVVQDNGAGFDLHAVGADQRHLGTLLMRERAQRSGGMLLIHSHPGHGTQVTLTYPAAQQA